jgi:hypothetical protein
MTRPKNAFECGTCHSWWTGQLTSHCSGCHRTFTGLTAFDAHRDGNHANGTRHCVDPATLTDSKGQPAPLVDAGRSYPCWGYPSDGTEWWKTDGAA